MRVVVTIVVLLLVGIWGAGIYNRLGRLRTHVLNGWKQLRALQEDPSATEDTIGLARQSYNDIATRYNTALQVVPNNVVAGLAGFKPARLETKNPIPDP